jgi:steroid 5-alpha reductase family enzyme
VTLILAGAAAVILLMLALWAIHFPMHNAAIVDAGWTGGLAVLGVIYAIGGDGWLARKVLIGAMPGLWGLRLAVYLLRTRIIGHPEEGRYVELRRKWRTNLGLKFLAFFEFQAILCLILSAPYFLAATNSAPGLSWIEIAGAVVWGIAILGESTADRQLAAFKASGAPRGKTCRIGLWRYSRHPNYFFEWLIWVGFALVALPAPYGWIGLLSPALILFFLLRVTGIPATEQQALRTRGEDYRDYQRTTSVFIPWFPKRSIVQKDLA